MQCDGRHITCGHTGVAPRVAQVSNAPAPSKELVGLAAIVHATAVDTLLFWCLSSLRQPRMILPFAPTYLSYVHVKEISTLNLTQSQSMSVPLQI